MVLFSWNILAVIVFHVYVEVHVRSLFVVDA